MAGYKQTELGVIPDDWKVKRLGDLGEVVRGGSPRPAGDTRYFNGSFIPWLTVASLTNISEHQVTVKETVGFLTEEGSKRSRTLPKQTLIIANSGATLGVAKILGLTCCANDGIAAIVNQQFGDKSFVCYYINTQTNFLRNVVATGNGQPNLNTGLIRGIPIPFPPLNEQRAIAQALSDVDALLAALNQLIAKKRDLKQAAMQQLLTGKTRLPRFSGEWQVKRLGELVQLSKIGINPSSTPETLFTHFSLPAFDANETPVVETGACIGSNKFLVPQDAVLLSKLNPRIPRIWAPLEVPINSVCSTEFLVLKPNADVDRKFLKCVCLSPNVCMQMELHAIGTTGSHQRIQPNQAMSIEVVIPEDPDEQTAIATVLSEMDAELSALEARRDKTRNIKQAMMQELLTGKTRLMAKEESHV